MLHEQTTRHIQSLSDADLLEYVLTGLRMYQPEAIAFAQSELDRRQLPPEQLESLRPVIIQKLAHHDAVASIDLTRPAAPSILCQKCCREVPNKYIEYRYNIGLVGARLHGSYKGHLCKKCSLRYFAKSMAICLLLGWWGFFSLFVNLAFLLSNQMQLTRTLFIPSAPSDARRPSFDADAAKKLEPHDPTIHNRLATGADISDIARDLATQVGLTPGQVWLYIQHLVHPPTPAAPSPDPWTYGFPVEPLKLAP